MADYQNFQFEMWRGDSEAFDAAITLAGLPVDITGCDLLFTAKRSLQDSDPVFQLTTPTEIVITDGPAGLCTINVAPADTASETQTVRCFCDLQLTDTLGNVSTLATGTLLIKLEVGS